MENHNLDELVLHTLDLLNWRLQRLEFLLHAPPTQDPQPTPVLPRIHKLEQSLLKLASQNDIVSNLLKLQSKHPDIFTPPPTTTLPPALPTAQKLATVLSAAPALQSTASQLRSLADTELPPTSSFAQWASLWPRIEDVAARQTEQNAEISELRRRSAVAVTRWHDVDVLAQMRCWVEWEGRVRRVEREIGRAERRRGDERG
ncbi:hypothetical protein BT63DRAFT_422002 [Microthyrium microscopicum]|uniref:Nuclear distribution protein RO10 n=1 Tax=Microthyrium microscopicum TaxID=703497 RepID=A0A6A6UNN9_9PEZI|nr:hypothetical protein BT63DRAFT_422002 [Microthyrium microscopicum]